MKRETLNRIGVIYALALVVRLNLHAWNEYWDVFPWLPRLRFLNLLHWVYPTLGILLFVPSRNFSRVVLSILLVLHWSYLLKFGESSALALVGLAFTIVGVWLFSRVNTWRPRPAA